MKQEPTLQERINEAIDDFHKQIAFIYSRVLFEKYGIIGGDAIIQSLIGGIIRDEIRDLKNRIGEIALSEKILARIVPRDQPEEYDQL